MAEPKKHPEYQDNATGDTSLQAELAEDGAAFEDREAALQARVAELEAERDESRDRMLRALADAENSRKRAEKDRRDAMLYGGAKLVRDMLPVYDNLARALEAANSDARSAAPGLVEGVELTLRELVNILSKHGVERIAPKPGDMFDPHLHQAMFEAPVPDYPAGQIIQVMTEGFRLHDQLLRPAQVGVSSTPTN
jgi:molecular chaperone GrpE